MHGTSEALYNHIWVIDWATTDHDSKRAGHSDTQLGHSTRASTSTDREGEHQTETTIACVCCGRSAAASFDIYKGKTNSSPRGDESDETIKTCVFLTTTAASSSCSLRARAPCESESSLKDQRVDLRSSPRGAAFRLIAQPGVHHSSYQIQVPF